MNSEIEATFTDVNPEEVRAKLKVLHAEQIYPERLMRRQIFDYPDLRLDQKAAWVRLRDEGDKITLAYKERSDETIGGMKEVELVVDGFEETKSFLEAVGLTSKAYQESKRELWFINACHVTIDLWPWLNPLVEIEGPSEELVRQASDELGFDWSKALFDSADSVYIQSFEVSRTEISSTDLVFGPIPEWLEAKRK
jgi:adenylate cyclase class 2